MLAPFRATLENTPRAAPRMPLVSTATGLWLEAAQAASIDYWTTHLRKPVRFAAALRQLLDAPARVLLEVGPRATLATLARQQLAGAGKAVVAQASLADTPASEVAAFRLALGQLWSRGVPVDVAMLDRRQRRQRVRLPTYPFERQRCWVEAAPAVAAAAPSAFPATPMAAMPAAIPEITMPVANPPVVDRRPRLVAQLKEVFEDITGVELDDVDGSANFIELGLDSLMLTQVALHLSKVFPVKVTFRQLMVDYANLDRLAALLDEQMPPEAAAPAPVARCRSRTGRGAGTGSADRPGSRRRQRLCAAGDRPADAADGATTGLARRSAGQRRRDARGRRARGRRRRAVRRPGTGGRHRRRRGRRGSRAGAYPLRRQEGFRGDCAHRTTARWS